MPPAPNQSNPRSWTKILLPAGVIVALAVSLYALSALNKINSRMGLLENKVTDFDSKLSLLNKI